MTNKPMLSVEREVIEKALRDALTIRFDTDSHVTKLRALLDEPAPERKPFAWYRVPKDFPLQGAFFPYIEGQSERDIQTSVEAEFGFNVKRLYDKPAYPRVSIVKAHTHNCACVVGDSGVCDCGAVVDGVAVEAKPAAQHQGEPTPITGDMDRLMEAYRLGEFSAESGSDTVEALSVASFDAVESHGHDADSYMAGYCAALYEQGKPFIGLALKPKHQGEPVAWLNIATGHVTTSAVVVMDWDDEKEQVQSLYAEQPAPVAVAMPFKLKTIVRTSYSDGWNEALAEVARLNGVKP